MRIALLLVLLLGCAEDSMVPTVLSESMPTTEPGKASVSGEWGLRRPGSGSAVLGGRCARWIGGSVMRCSIVGSRHICKGLRA